jgi:hypothetical protein
MEQFDWKADHLERCRKGNGGSRNRSNIRGADDTLR